MAKTDAYSTTDGIEMDERTVTEPTVNVPKKKKFKTVVLEIINLLWFGLYQLLKTI